MQGNVYNGGTVNMTDGELGSVFAARAGSRVNVSGGTVGANFGAFADSEIDIRGGTLPGTFRAFADSSIWVHGSSFAMTDPSDPASMIDLTSSLVPGDPLLITSRVGSLTGTLADGSTFTFNLASYISAQAALSIMIDLAGDLNGDGFVGLDDLTSFFMRGTPTSRPATCRPAISTVTASSGSTTWTSCWATGTPARRPRTYPLTSRAGDGKPDGHDPAHRRFL